MIEYNIAIATDDEQIRQLYETAFPEDEQIPWEDLMRLVGEMPLDLFIFRECRFIQLFYLFVSIGCCYLFCGHNSIVSPSLVISQKGINFSSVNSFIRHEDSNPLATKCMGTNIPTLNRSINCRPPSV